MNRLGLADREYMRRDDVPTWEPPPKRRGLPWLADRVALVACGLIPLALVVAPAFVSWTKTGDGIAVWIGSHLP
jgi:hypothetical protein